MRSNEELKHQQDYFTRCAEHYDNSLPERLGYTLVKQGLLEEIERI